MAVTSEERVALALSALTEVTDGDDIGEVLAVQEVEPGVVDVLFACTLAAYAGWHWTVSTADLPDREPTVLEVALTPGDGALLAPPWVPWAERLAEWRRQHPDERHPGEDADDEADLEDDTDRDDEDADELDEDDLAVDDELDELDETELEGAESPEEIEPEEIEPGEIEPEEIEPEEIEPEEIEPEEIEPEEIEQDSGDIGDEDDEALRGPRPADEDRSL